MTFHHVLRQYPNHTEFWIDTYRNGKRVLELAWRLNHVGDIDAQFSIATTARNEQYRNNYVAFEYFVR